MIQIKINDEEYDGELYSCTATTSLGLPGSMTAEIMLSRNDEQCGRISLELTGVSLGTFLLNEMKEKPITNWRKRIEKGEK